MITKPNKAEQLIYKALNRALEQNKLDIYLDFSKINRPNCPLYNPWEAILPLLAPTLLGLIMIMTGWVISGLFFISVMMMGYSQYYKKILHKKLAQRCREYITFVVQYFSDLMTDNNNEKTIKESSNDEHPQTENKTA